MCHPPSSLSGVSISLKSSHRFKKIQGIIKTRSTAPAYTCVTEKNHHETSVRVFRLKDRKDSIEIVLDYA